RQRRKLPCNVIAPWAPGIGFAQPGPAELQHAHERREILRVILAVQQRRLPGDGCEKLGVFSTRAASAEVSVPWVGQDRAGERANDASLRRQADVECAL